MIPNGVNTDVYAEAQSKDLTQFRRRFALPGERIVLFVGRLVYEKGVHVLVNAIPKVLEKVDAKTVIVGNGYMKEQISGIVKGLGIDQKVMFTGFVDDETLRRLQTCAAVSVVPSLFEPFGIVALEAMAAKSPVVVSDTGGLAEIVDHDVDGIKVYPNNPDSLAWGITRVLTDERNANRLRSNAYKKIQEKYDWDRIAKQTRDVYRTVLNDYSNSFWAPKEK
jgi:glycosyltransferase involved in cell wall biosynthesis